MTASSFDPYALLAESRLGVLATIKADGRPQLSPVMPFYDRQAGVIYVSMRAGLAKTANLRRDARATLEVTRPDGRAWATAEGTATLTGPGKVWLQSLPLSRLADRIYKAAPKTGRRTEEGSVLDKAFGFGNVIDGD